ncbi:hypothetical protein DV515_00012767, partial [Chloebia gouldiae]
MGPKWGLKHEESDFRLRRLPASSAWKDVETNLITSQNMKKDRYSLNHGNNLAKELNYKKNQLG